MKVSQLNDGELVVLAGIRVRQRNATADLSNWSSLANNGDAFELAMWQGFLVESQLSSGETVVIPSSADNQAVAHQGDILAASRRAITLAAVAEVLEELTEPELYSFLPHRHPDAAKGFKATDIQRISFLAQASTFSDETGEVYPVADPFGAYCRFEDALAVNPTLPRYAADARYVRTSSSLEPRVTKAVEGLWCKWADVAPFVS